MSNSINGVKYTNNPSQPSKKTRDQTQDDRLAALEKSRERESKRTNAYMALGSLKLSVDMRTKSWQEAAKHIGSAYVMAYSKHKEVLGKEAAEKALGIQMVFSILTVVTAGSLAWVGLSARLAGMGLSELVRESIEDAAQAGVGEVFSAVAPLVFAPSMGPVGIDPQIFQNNLETNILSMMREIDKVFKDIIDILRGAKLEKWDHYDENIQAARHYAWQKKAAGFSGVEDLPIDLNGNPSMQMMADELERGIWAKYILSERYYRDFGIFKTAPEYEFVGINVCKRLAELGVLKLTYNAMNVPESEEYILNPKSIAALAGWAKGYQPTTFAEMRKKQEKIGAAIKHVARPALKYFGNLRRK